MRHLLAIGMGYSARALAVRLKHDDRWRISGSARSGSGARAIAAAGFDGFEFAGPQPAAAVRERLVTATHLLVSASPDYGGDPLLAAHGADIGAAPHLQWIGYLSTIGVYGDQAGGWVDETTPTLPSHERGRRRVAAERQWLELGSAGGSSKRVQVFRLGGIYGPGRSAIDNLRDGTARSIVKPGQVFNRIHVDDIALVLEAAMAKQTAHQHAIFNVVDDEPAPPQDVIAFAAGLLGIAPPPALEFAATPLTPMARSFYSENKRVRNDRMKQTFGITLAYPTYREGMRAITAAR